MVTHYVRADISQVTRTDWRGYIADLDVFFSGSTKAAAEYDAHRVLEEQFSYRPFVIIWNQC